MVQYILKREFQKGRLVFIPPADTFAQENIRRELKKCRDRFGDYVLITMQAPKKPRSTGPGSQSHHLNGHVQQIADRTGLAFDLVKYCIKMLAVEEMDYPHAVVDGHVWPQSEADCSSGECALLIEAAHVWAARHGIELEE